MPKIVDIGKGRGLGVRVKLSPSMLYYTKIHFLVPSTHHEKRGLTLNSPKNMFNGKFVPGGNTPFLPPKTAFLTLELNMGVSKKHPIFLR